VGPRVQGKSARRDERKRATVRVALDPLRQRPEIRHALQLVIWQLNTEMMFQSRQQIKRLQTVNTKRLEKVAVGRQLLSRTLKCAAAKLKISSSVLSVVA